nr:hypothetical protein [uncultured Flavobacterium sp.]
MSNKAEILRISDFTSEILVGFGLFFIIYSPFVTFGDKNIENLGLFRLVFPALSIIITIVLYRSTYIVYYNPSERIIYIRKPFGRKILESLSIRDLKEAKISQYFEKKQFQFESGVTKRRYKTIVRGNMLAIVRSWL